MKLSWYLSDTTHMPSSLLCVHARLRWTATCQNLFLASHAVNDAAAADSLCSS